MIEVQPHHRKQVAWFLSSKLWIRTSDSELRTLVFYSRNLRLELLSLQKFDEITALELACELHVNGSTRTSRPLRALQISFLHFYLLPICGLQAYDFFSSEHIAMFTRDSLENYLAKIRRI